MKIDQESDELSNFLGNLASVHVDKRRNTAVTVSHLAPFARIFTIYSFHGVFWHYTTLPKPFLGSAFNDMFTILVPDFSQFWCACHKAFVDKASLSSVLNVLLFLVSLLNTPPSQWLVYISPASVLFFLRLLFSERYRRSEADIPYETAACSFPRVGCLIILRWCRETVRGVL